MSRVVGHRSSPPARARASAGPSSSPVCGAGRSWSGAWRAFEAHPRVDAIVLVLPDAGGAEDALRATPRSSPSSAGGERRQDSVGQRVGRPRAPGRRTSSSVHDGARPLVDPDLIEPGHRRRPGPTARPCPVLPLEDTVKEVARRPRRPDARPRPPGPGPDPAGIRGYDVLQRALDAAREAGFSGTDEACPGRAPGPAGGRRRRRPAQHQDHDARSI